MSQLTTITYNGLEIGEIDSGYGISRLSGFGAPEISTSEQQKADNDGSNIYAQKYNSRIMQFDIEVMGVTVNDYLAKAREFVKRFKINVDDFLVIKWNGNLKKIKAVYFCGTVLTFTRTGS